MPGGASRFIAANSITFEPLANTHESDQSYNPLAFTTTFTPFLDVIPSPDGTLLYIRAGGVGQLGGTVVANVDGPTSKKGHTMTYSNTLEAYTTTADGFTPGQDQGGNISITTTLGLDTGLVDFNRAYVPPATTPAINSIDGNLQLTVVSTDTFPAEAYVTVVPSYAPPGPPPAGHRLIGSVYSARASGALPATNKPMSLDLVYNETGLTGADPHTLSIFAWDANPANPHWDHLGGDLFPLQSFISVATSRFTTYALMTSPTWRDDFDEFSGLDFTQFDNVTVGGTPGQRTLILLNTPGSGSAVSQPITPTGFINWDILTYSNVVTPPTTTLSVDILSPDSSKVLANNVTSGSSLAGLIDPAKYPSLRLRVNLASSAAGQTPALDKWQLSWEVGVEYIVYLPVVVK
jgi:hypothetical protein